jgi:DNA-binding Lrp family transcriptional regulator
MTIKKRILDLLRKNGPMLSMDIAAILKLSKGTASQSAKELHDHGFVHIIEWRTNAKNGGNKVYKIGPGKDAVKPEANWQPRAKIEPYKKVPFIPRSANWWLTT